MNCQRGHAWALLDVIQPSLWGLHYWNTKSKPNPNPKLNPNTNLLLLHQGQFCLCVLTYHCLHDRAPSYLASDVRHVITSSPAVRFYIEPNGLVITTSYIGRPGIPRGCGTSLELNTDIRQISVVISDIPAQSEVAAVQCVFSRRLNITDCCITDISPMPNLRQRLVYSAPATFLCDSVTLIFATIIIIIIIITASHWWLSSSPPMRCGQQNTATETKVSVKLCAFLTLLHKEYSPFWAIWSIGRRRSLDSLRSAVHQPTLQNHSDYYYYYYYYY